jgi:hypothetical protein
LKLHIQDILNERVVRYKGVELTSFDLTFNVNFFLPDYIGLGKGVSIGFGSAHVIEKDKSE